MNFNYCPRITYYVHVLKIPQTTTVKEYRGREKYEDFKKRSKRLKVVHEFPHLERKYDVFLEHEGLSTRIDCVLFDGDYAYPIQLKYAYKSPTVYRTTYQQLLLEAFLIENVFRKKVKEGFVKYQKSDALVRVDLGDRSSLTGTIQEIKNIGALERFPKPTQYIKRCTDCCYRKLCWMGANAYS